MHKIEMATKLCISFLLKTVLCSSNHVNNIFKELADKNETSNMIQIITDTIQVSASLMQLST